MRLSFYVLFLGLIFRNYLLSPKLNHGFSGENTTFLKTTYKYTHHTKYLPLEVHILSTSNFNRIDRFKHKIALKNNFQSNHFSQPNHDNEFTLWKKLDKTIFDSEISIPNYSLMRKDRNRKGWRVACYIRSNICFNSQNYLSDEIENISFDLLLPKTKPISIAIVYKPPTDNHFLDYLSKGLNDFNLMENDIFIIGHTNINILNKNENIFDKYKDIHE